MFEDYLVDAKEFYDMAEANRNNEQLAKRYYRVAVFCTLSAAEAYVNYLATGFLVSDKLLSDQEIAFLNDKEIIFDAQKGKVREKTRYFSIEDKVKFLLTKFPANLSFDVGSDKRWSYFSEIKDLRNTLIHPREISDDIPIEQYRNTLFNGLKSIIEIINIISQKVYNKSLRRKVLDLIPE